MRQLKTHITNFTLKKGDVFWNYSLKDENTWSLIRCVVHEHAKEEGRMRFTWGNCTKVFCRSEAECEHFFTSKEEAVWFGITTYIRQHNSFETINELNNFVRMVSDALCFYKTLFEKEDDEHVIAITLPKLCSISAVESAINSVAHTGHGHDAVVTTNDHNELVIKYPKEENENE